MKKIAGMAIFCATLITVWAECNPDWWKGLALEPTPTNDYGHAAAVLRQQGRSVSFLSGTDYGVADVDAATNLWYMLAALHGDIRGKKIENPPTVFRNFGIITNQAELQQRIAENEMAKKICSYESLRVGLEERIEKVFSKAAKSQALSSFPASERNAIVSNLVATAQLTPIEAVALGLTNIVVEAGGSGNAD